MPLYQCQPPTGYKDSADAWTNTGALVARMNFALALTSGRMPPPAASERGPALEARARAFGMPGRGFVDATPSSLESWQTSVEAALGRDLSETTRATVAKATAPAQRIALVLGSPEFQRR